MAGNYTLTVREGPRVERASFSSLGDAIDELERHVRVLTMTVRRSTIDMKVRRFEPVAQVAARAEVAGPGRWRPRVRAGVDVRGDGSLEPYLGRLHRAVVEQRAGESAYDALRRVLIED